MTSNLGERERDARHTAATRSTYHGLILEVEQSCTGVRRSHSQ